HGEGGDDQIHGMSFTDSIFGDGQDDDLYGNAGWDWISGGAGVDGILGDDGLLSTSRNGLTEPLWGVTTANAQITIATPGNLQSAVIYVTGELRKEADLVPFWIGNNDIVYGGLGNDFIHGGVGDDALSGAEALPLYYDTLDPVGRLQAIAAFIAGLPTSGANAPAWRYDINGQLGDVLRHNQPGQIGEFDAYDEFDPWRKVLLTTLGGQVVLLDGRFGAEFNGQPLDFLLNFANDTLRNQVVDDGKDTIFGDVGDDWIVGGTNHDRLWGGWGDDLLQSDDDLNSAPDTPGDTYANDTPDVSPGPLTYADIAYGGAGRDILIGNTGADRMIDWVGEFNSYVVPFSPFGAFTISRQIAPALQTYLLQLSRADGADRTRGTGEALSNDERQGEPFGEIALVNQKDPFWQDQTGAPDDPQPGNDRGRRDVLRSEDFTQTANLFAPAEGTWSVTSGTYQSAATRSTDAISIFYVDSFLPRYFEVVATIFADKAKGGFQSNGYVILDYQGPGSFKFAGIDTARDKVQIGYRASWGWQVVAEVGMQLLDNRTYEVLVAVDGTRVTVFVDGVQKVSYLFDATLVDPNQPEAGFRDPLTDGYLGLGSVESVGGITGFRVQVRTPEITLSVTDGFDGSTNLISSTGTWTLGSSAVQAAPPITAPALASTRFQVAPAARTELTTVVRTGATAGIAYDVAGPLRFKWVVLSPTTGQLLLGHYASNGWTVDAALPLTLDPAVEHTLRVVLTGNVVTVWVNDVKVAVRSYTALLNDGDVGLVSYGGSATFSSFTTATDDPDLRGAALPNVTVGDAIVVEGTGGTRTVDITVTLSAPSSTPVSVDWSTADVLAAAGSDYVAASGTLQFAAGQTSATITITIVTDATFEGDETFLIRLTGASGAVIVDNTAVVTITNDDTAATPTVTIADVTVNEGATTTTVTLTLTLDTAPTAPVSVAWSTVEGTATAGSDYTAAAGTVTFGIGQITATISVTILGDPIFEANEALSIQLSNPVGVAVGRSSATVTLTNDDAAPLVSVTATDAAGAEAGTNTMVFTVTRSGNLNGPITVGLSFTGTATYAGDYVVSTVAGATWNATNRTITFAAGATTATVTVTPVNDTAPEQAETVIVTVLAGTGYLTTTPTSATATIADDDLTLPSASVLDASVLEGNKGQVWVNVTIQLSTAPTTSVSLTVRTVDGTATNGVDYRGIVTTVTFAAGQTTAIVAVRVLGDRVREGNETFLVQLLDPVGLAIARNQATVTILDDDGTARVAAAATAPQSGATLTDADIPAVLALAAAWWAQQGAVVPADLQVVVTDLPATAVAHTIGTTVYVDADAAGFGWHLDPTTPVADGAVDLLSVLTHELGHALGFDHTETGIMAPIVEPGTRLVAPASAAGVSHVSDTVWSAWVPVAAAVRAPAELTAAAFTDASEVASGFVDRLESVPAPAQGRTDLGIVLVGLLLALLVVLRRRILPLTPR
ncbi:MAG: matrixin family metalloprotease, partial [Ilumatobacteraceae bacterium]|nr:matrixin family metalloprotease [Ilumatobacteraceae bacterium]